MTFASLCQDFYDIWLWCLNLSAEELLMDKIPHRYVTSNSWQITCLTIPRHTVATTHISLNTAIKHFCSLICSFPYNDMIIRPEMLKGSLLWVLKSYIQCNVANINIWGFVTLTFVRYKMMVNLLRDVNRKCKRCCRVLELTVVYN